MKRMSPNDNRHVQPGTYTGLIYTLIADVGRTAVARYQTAVGAEGSSIVQPAHESLRSFRPPQLLLLQIGLLHTNIHTTPLHVVYVL